MQKHACPRYETSASLGRCERLYRVRVITSACVIPRHCPRFSLPGGVSPVEWRGSSATSARSAGARVGGADGIANAAAGSQLHRDVTKLFEALATKPDAAPG